MSTKVQEHGTMLGQHAPPPAQHVSDVPPEIQQIRDISDAMHWPPTTIDFEFLGRYVRAANILGNPPKAVYETQNASKPLGLSATTTNPWGSVTNPYFSAEQGAESDASIDVRNSAMAARNNVFDVINDVNSFVALAKNAGFSPPDNPFSVISQLNSQRSGLQPVNVSIQLANDLLANISVYLQLLRAEREGKIDLEKNVNSSAQLSSVTLSLDGFGGSGDVAADLMRFLPDADAIKEQQAREALAILDFKKRIPKVLFTANYSPDGDSKGCIVGWKKIADASGYVVKRRNIFDGSEQSFVFTNQDIASRYEHVKEYVKAWVLSFYDTVDHNQVLAFLDSTIGSHQYYVYRVLGYQIQNESKGTLFNVDVIPANISQVQRNEIRRQLESVDPGSGPDTISPYPLLAKHLLGNDQHDWILSGVNIRSSIIRNDSRTNTRKFSYLAAQLDFLFQQMDAGLFVIPKNVNDIASNVTDSIGRFGVTQVIEELITETGILYFFDGKDAKEDTHFDKVGFEQIHTSNLLSTVMAAVDPETATLDLQSLSSNLPQLLSGGPLLKSKLGQGQVRIESEEIDTTFDANNPTTSHAEDEIQFLREVDLRSHVIDLTTFEGLSKFLRTLRIFSDIGPNRSAPVDAQFAEFRPATTPPGTPTPPTPPFTSPTSLSAPPKKKERPKSKGGRGKYGRNDIDEE